MNTSVPSQRALSGATLRALREGAGLSLREVAAWADVHYSHLARVENGERDVTPALADRVTRAIAAHLKKGTAA